ncbi:MAG TPA: TRAM domain-containing protein, partial [Ruminococcus sp.]|nr:TRAM domain-containing protein [Ruminococcus sp.]
MLAKNQLHTAEITGLTSEGSGVCRVEEIAVFVPETAVGDVIELRIVKVMSSYAFGIVEKILTPSPDRILPDCPVYKKCGGCVYRHISYAAECRAKDTVVRDAFTRLGGLSPQFDSFISAEETCRYRN